MTTEIKLKKHIAEMDVAQLATFTVIFVTTNLRMMESLDRMLKDEPSQHIRYFSMCLRQFIMKSPMIGSDFMRSLSEAVYAVDCHADDYDIADVFFFNNFLSLLGCSVKAVASDDVDVLTEIVPEYILDCERAERSLEWSGAYQVGDSERSGFENRLASDPIFSERILRLAEVAKTVLSSSARSDLGRLIDNAFQSVG